MSAQPNIRVRLIDHRDPLGLAPLRRLPATPCSQCDRASRYQGRIGQPLCREHARVHYGITRRPRHRQNLAAVVLLERWRGGAR